MNHDNLDDESPSLRAVDDFEEDDMDVVLFEYMEDYAQMSSGWTERLNKLAADGWRLRFVLMDEDGGKHVGRRRLILERIAGEEVE